MSKSKAAHLIALGVAGLMLQACGILKKPIRNFLAALSKVPHNRPVPPL